MLKSQRAAAAAMLVVLDVLSLFVAFSLAWALRDSLGNFLVALGDIIHAPFREMVRRPGDLPVFYRILLSRNPLIDFNSHLWLFWISLPLWIYFLSTQRAYDSHEPKSSRQVFASCAYAGFLATAALVIFLFLAKFNGVSRLLITNFFLAGTLVLWFGRLVTLPLLQKRGGKTSRHILIIGHRKAALRFAAILGAPAYRWSKLIGFVSDSEDCVPSTPDDGTPAKLGCLNDLEHILDDRVVDEVVIVRSTADAAQDTPENNQRWGNLLQLCLERGRTVSLFDDMVPPVGAKVEATMMGSMPMLVLHNTPQNAIHIAVKNVMDRILAAIALFFLAPIFAVIALLIKFHDKGPVFFAQERVGLNGRIFKFWKFRSMHINAQAILQKMKEEDRARYDSINIMEDPFFKARDGDDPRITPIGRFIRRYSLDELPQFYNVLRGDMSLVGPRPPLPKEVEELKAWHRRKLSVKGGLTCLWQVSGRNDITDVDEWMRLDLEYIDNWSLWLDVKLLFKTLKVLVKPRGAS
jgi:exopolysaccharide biosynthesis polyprenyl glycosylphosphotransferase